MSLRDAWDEQAEAWAAWARAPGHDSYWRFHREAFLPFVPPPGRLTLDVGCGEGRVGRDLLALGHSVVAVDGSPTLARLAATHEQPLAVALADAAALPVPDGVADLVVAFMSLQDVDDLRGSIAEIARVLETGGRLCLAVVHPINAAGIFTGERDDHGAPFCIAGSYFDERRYADSLERGGLQVTFHSRHHTLESYCRAVTDGGLLIEAVREVRDPTPGDRWNRIPLFLHLRAVRTR